MQYAVNSTSTSVLKRRRDYEQSARVSQYFVIITIHTAHTKLYAAYSDLRVIILKVFIRRKIGYKIFISIWFADSINIIFILLSGPYNLCADQIYMGVDFDHYFISLFFVTICILITPDFLIY